MPRLNSVLRNRLLPAILTATGVSLIAGGLLTYTGAAEVDPEPSPTIISLAPTPTLELPTYPPSSESPSPSASPSVAVDRVATRVIVPALGIDLPVIKQPDASYPSCNVAMYFEYPGLGQPGQGISTYLYAHARKGMFLALLDASKKDRGRAMLGASVEVFTSDSQVFLYEIYEVRPRVPADLHWLDDPLAVTEETLWLQTSTGPGGQYPKLQVLARPLTVGPATYAESHPKAKPVNCR